MHYVSNTKEDQEAMLKEIGAKSVTDLFEDIPSQLLLDKPIDMPSELSELEVKRLLDSLAAKNGAQKLSFLGAGSYNHFSPTIVNHLLLRGEFMSAYTPYQPEMSQGVLQSIFEFQTMIARLTGMDLANASMYDNSSALAEAALMACRVKRKKKILISKAVHPEHIEVVKTYTDANDVQLEIVNTDDGVTLLPPSSDYAGLLIQQPNFFGSIEDLKKLAEKVHADDAMLVVSVNEPTSLGLLQAPGDQGADIVVGEGHSIGNAMSYGGPFVGFMATKKEFMRQIPGRLAGMTKDGQGRRGFALTLQAREQHIRREKALSNICTNQALNALAFTIALATYGKEFKTLADHNVQKAHYASSQLVQAGLPLAFTEPFYNEFVVKVQDMSSAQQSMKNHNMIPGLDLGKYYPELENHMLLCVTEMHTKQDIDQLVESLKGK